MLCTEKGVFVVQVCFQRVVLSLLLVYEWLLLVFEWVSVENFELTCSVDLFKYVPCVIMSVVLWIFRLGGCESCVLYL